MSLLSNRSEVREFALPTQIALVLFGLAFNAFVVRLWYLQVVKGDAFRAAAENIATEKRPKPATRGKIFDTAGNVLADNRPSYNLKVTLSQVPDFPALAEKLAGHLKVPVEEIHASRAAAQKKVGFSSYKPAVLMEDLTREQVARLELYRSELFGAEVDYTIKRTYKYGDLLAQQVGYLGEVGERDLVKLRAKYARKYGEDYYQLGHFWGKYGVEQKFEELLKAKDGLRIAAKDRLGRELSLEDAGRLLEEFRTLGSQTHHEVPGNNVRLSIDLGLQQHIAKAFGEESGAVVVIDVKTGLIRAMFNHPTFDPEIFARGISKADWEALSQHPDHPLEDKAIRGMYPPGSTWKLFTAAAGIGEKVIDARTTYNCTGQMFFGNRTYRCWNKRGHGTVNLRKAIQQSCDVFFYNVGLKVGVDTLARYAQSFGFGKPTGIGLNDEKKGLVPTTEWKRMNRREEWQEGETLSVAIGQGFDLVTPLQLAVAYAAIANGGKVMEPHLVEQVVRTDGKVLWEQTPRVAGRAEITPEGLDLLRDGLFAVVNEPGGTAYWTGRVDEVKIAGKTGTSQVFRQEERLEKDAVLPRELRDHALFAAYAPAADPQIAIAVIVEHGEHGSSAAAPIAKAVVEYWFRNELAAMRADRAGRKPAPAATPTPGGPAVPTAPETAAPGGTVAPAPTASPDAATPEPPPIVEPMPAEPAETPR